jgi:hypothetical protein
MAQAVAGHEAPRERNEGARQGGAVRECLPYAFARETRYTSLLEVLLP